MVTGRSRKIVGQTGEYLVAAEFSRRWLIATTLTGNVPHYGIIASDESGRHVSIQVKASRGGSWQFGDVLQLCESGFDAKHQVVCKPMACPVRGLVVVFVTIEDNRQDRSYIITWQRLRDVLIRLHTTYLQQHDGVRPKRWDSLHSAITEETLRLYQDKWDTIEKNLK